MITHNMFTFSKKGKPTEFKQEISNYPGQSLKFENLGGLFNSVGVVMPGEYDFGMATTDETITVLSGIIYINGTCYSPGKNKMAEIKKGEKNVWSVEYTAAYFCQFY